MLVVVAILSAASLLAFGVFAEDRTQLRYDDTRQRLHILRRAILGQNGPANAETSAGFVADNGALPSDLLTLLQAGSLATRGVRSPVFDPKPDDATCANDGSADDITLTDPASQLVKGHVGDYLGGLAVNGRFRDGWGNVASADDAANFGWSTLFDEASKRLSITSLGLDNALDGNGFSADFGLSVAANDWLIPLAGWTIQIRNLTASDIPEGTLAVNLLVFVNDSADGKWLRYTTQPLACLDAHGANADGLCPGSAGTAVAGSDMAAVAFIDGCKPGVTAAGRGRIPQGRHLLVVNHSGADKTPWTIDDTLTWGSSPTHGPIFTQIDVVAGHNLPAVTLEIR